MAAEKWFARASRHKDVRAACVISAHLAMLLQNATPGQIDARAMTTLLASHVFLTHNFAWDAEKPVIGESDAATAAKATRRRGAAAAEHELGMPQTLVFDLFQRA